MEKVSIMSAIKQICAEKNLSFESVIETIETALAAAYRKDFGNKLQNIKVKFNPETGASEAIDVKTVVEDLPPEEEQTEEDEDTKTQKHENMKTQGESRSGDEEIKKLRNKEIEDEGEEEEEKRRFNPKMEIQLSEAKKIKKDAKIDDEIITELEIPDAYGRMAAQTAKQVIIQKLREAERINLFEEFKSKEGKVLSGVIQRHEPHRVLIDLGKTTAILPREEQISKERYNAGEHLKVLVKSVNLGARGPEIIVSRSHQNMIYQLFALEIPEIESGIVEVKSIAREAGFRSKVAVFAEEEGIDPIGSCVGQRGTRIQTIINELGGEKIDIIEYDEDPGVFIANALAPAKVISIEVDEKGKSAVATVKEDQFSLAIGKEGQNVRLAAKLTGWKINIVGNGGDLVAEASPSGEHENNETMKHENTENTENNETQKTKEESKEKEVVTKKVGKKEIKEKKVDKKEIKKDSKEKKEKKEKEKEVK
jgi:N utilization substance protein A